MLQDREETGKDAQCCFCDLSVTRCFLPWHGDGQCSTLDLRGEKSLIFKCGSVSLKGSALPTGANKHSLTQLTQLSRWDLWQQLGSGAEPWPCTWGKDSGCPEQAEECPAQPCARGQAGDSLHQCHCKSSAKPWPQEILISRNKRLFHLMGQPFPMV